MTCETAHPFAGCRAHSALVGDGGTGSFCLLIPQTQQYEGAREYIWDRVSVQKSLLVVIFTYSTIIITIITARIFKVLNGNQGEGEGNEYICGRLTQNANFLLSLYVRPDLDP
jgi:hypothetical protein